MAAHRGSDEGHWLPRVHRSVEGGPNPAPNPNPNPSPNPNPNPSPNPNPNPSPNPNPTPDPTPRSTSSTDGSRCANVHVRLRRRGALSCSHGSSSRCRVCPWASATPCCRYASLHPPHTGCRYAPLHPLSRSAHVREHLRGVLCVTPWPRPLALPKPYVRCYRATVSTRSPTAS